MMPLLILRSNVPLAESFRKDIVDHIANGEILFLGPDVDIVHLDKDGNLDYATQHKEVPTNAET